MSKPWTSLAALVVMLGVAENLSAQGLTNSKHDFTSNAAQSVYTSATSKCTVCHTPHASSTTIKPLWNHATTSQTFTMYSSSTLDGSIETGPVSVSKACLSCHDGVTAVDSYGSTTGSATIANTSNAYVGLSLTGDHPISIQYGQPTADFVTASGSSGAKYLLAGTIKLPLYNDGTDDNVECGSCHNPHYWASTTEGNAGYRFLRAQQSQGLCTACHNK